MSTALHIALCSLPYSSRLEANQCAGALSLFVIVSALRAYKQLRVPLAWRGGTKKTAAGRINKKIAAENKKVVTRVHWYRFMPPTGTNAVLWSRLGAPTGSNAHPLVPVGAPNRDQRSSFPTLWAAEKRPLVPVGGTNRD